MKRYFRCVKDWDWWFKKDNTYQSEDGILHCDHGWVYLPDMNDKVFYSCFIELKFINYYEAIIR